MITFDHHPDEVLRGTAPALLLDPQERLERLEAAGLAVTVVQHFDDALRRTPYDAFVERIRSRLTLTGFLMTPDAAFGFERRGTPVTLAALGARDGFDVVVVPPFTIDGHEVRSSEIRTAIAAGDFDGAARLLGRPVTITGAIGDPVDGGARLDFRLPVALPPDGEYAVRVGGASRALRIRDGDAYLFGQVPKVASRSSSERPDPSSLSRRRGSRVPRQGSSRRRQPGRRGRAPPRPVRRSCGVARDPPHDAHAGRGGVPRRARRRRLAGDPTNQRLTLDKTDIRPRAPITARRRHARGSRSGP